MGKLLACLFVRPNTSAMAMNKKEENPNVPPVQMLDQMIHLFNTENYKDKPFQTFTIEAETKEIKQMKFSPNGKYILLGTQDNLITLLDANLGSITKRFSANFNPSSLKASL